MKKTISLILALVLLFGLTPTAFAANNSGTMEPPFSKQYLENINGITYLSYVDLEDSTSDDGTLAFTHYTMEGYDVTALLQNSGGSWDKVINEFRNAFKNAGLREVEHKGDDGEIQYMYSSSNLDEHRGFHVFSIVPRRQYNGIVILHLYSTPTNTPSFKAGFENFKRVNQYPDGKFSDVKAADWFSSGVKLAYELGLITGVSETAFSPASEITVAQTITIASRLNSIYRTGQANFAQSEIWYIPYVDYAVQNGIIASGQYTNYDEAITRGHFASIMHAALPADAWTSINSINSLPDVDVTTQIGKSVLALYQAGVLTGNDQYGTFSPDNKIQRSEAAAMLTRMAIPSERKTFSLVSLPVYVTLPTSVTIVKNDTRKIRVEIGVPTENADTSLTWTSSNPAIVSVDENGTITGKRVGTAEITATSINGKSGTCKVTVLSPEDVDVKFAKETLSRLKIGLKFPDTLKLYNIWAFSYGDGKICIYIYFSAENSLGLQRRMEYYAAYTLDSGEFIFDNTNDGTSSHVGHRPVDIHKVTK